MRPQLAPAVAFVHANGLQDLDEFARLMQLADADAVDGRDEGGRAAVHDRHFAGVDLDVAVVDAQAAQRRQQVLDGADGNAGLVAQDGAQREILHEIDVGRDFSDDAAAFADQEAVADVGLRRVQNHRYVGAAVDPSPR